MSIEMFPIKLTINTGSFIREYPTSLLDFDKKKEIYEHLWKKYQQDSFFIHRSSPALEGKVEVAASERLAIFMQSELLENKDCFTNPTIDQNQIYLEVLKSIDSSMKDRNLILFACKIQDKLPSLELSNILRAHHSLHDQAIAIRACLQENQHLLQEINDLDLSHAQLTQLPEELSLFTHLRSLNASNNLIHDISNFSTLRLSHLQHLNLSNNQIQSLHAFVFKGSPELKTLNLSENQIQKIDSSAFQYIAGYRDEKIQHDNAMRTVRILLHKGLPNLKKLNLSFNQLSVLEPDTLTGLCQLQFLNLSFNQLKDLDPDTFRCLTRTQISPDDYDSLTNFQKYMISLHPPSACKKNTKLTQLNLSNNKIKRFSLTILQNIPELRMLNISENPIARATLDGFQIPHHSAKLHQD